MVYVRSNSVQIPPFHSHAALYHTTFIRVVQAPFVILMLRGWLGWLFLGAALARGLRRTSYIQLLGMLSDWGFLSGESLTPCDSNVSKGPRTPRPGHQEPHRAGLSEHRDRLILGSRVEVVQGWCNLGLHPTLWAVASYFVLVACAFARRRSRPWSRIFSFTIQTASC